jgi:Helicase associated domain
MLWWWLLRRRRRQHRLLGGEGQRRVGAASTATTRWWWSFLSIILWWTTLFLLLEIQPVPVPCDGYSFRWPPPLAPSRFMAARPNPNRLLLSVQSPTPDNNTAGAKPYNATAKQDNDETADRSLSFRTERNSKEWNATSTSDDDNHDRHSLVNNSSGNRKQSHLAQQQWNAKFEKLQEYKTVHGDCLVPFKYKCDDGTALGAWVVHQRSVRYTSVGGKRLDEQRRQALDSIGFVWIVRQGRPQLSPETGQYASRAEIFNAR